MRGARHSLDELSAGEHQVLILVYLISRWLQPGGIVLIDEPDLYLHPSLVSGLLANLEAGSRQAGTAHCDFPLCRYLAAL